MQGLKTKSGSHLAVRKGGLLQLDHNTPTISHRRKIRMPISTHHVLSTNRSLLPCRIYHFLHSLLFLQCRKNSLCVPLFQSSFFVITPSGMVFRLSALLLSDDWEMLQRESLERTASTGPSTTVPGVRPPSWGLMMVLTSDYSGSLQCLGLFPC